MRPANERRRYNVTSSLIGWMHSENDPLCMCPQNCVMKGLATYRQVNPEKIFKVCISLEGTVGLVLLHL